MALGEKDGSSVCSFADSNGQNLLQLGTAAGGAAFITGVDPSNVPVFSMNQNVATAKDFQRIP
jgi:hypothetical protein